MNVTKSGLVSSANIYESKALNVQYNTNYGDADGSKYPFTPTTGINSCMRDIVVHGEKYPSDIPMHARFKVSWSGFDRSNTAGEFSMYFQGHYQRSDGTTNWWTPLGDAATNVQDLGALVLSASSGSYVYDFTYNNLSSLSHEGFRCNYSNGTATITISDVIVVPVKYYVPESPTSNIPSFHMGKDYISARDYYEL